MTETDYVVIRDPETHECFEYYEFDNRDEAEGFIVGLRTGNKKYQKLLINIEGVEPEDDQDTET